MKYKCLPVMCINSLVFNKRDKLVQQQRACEPSHIGYEFQNTDTVELKGEAFMQRTQ